MNNCIRLATENEIPVLCELWKACFPDSKEYIKYFYKENFAQISVVVYAVDGKPVSMVHVMDSCFADGEKKQNAKFLYAGGTFPEYRKNGYFGELMKYFVNDAEKYGYALFFKPSPVSLVPYYAKFGLQLDSYFRLVTITPGEKQPLSVKPLSPQEYNHMRDIEFSSRAYAKWDDSHLNWCVAENEYFSGKTIAINHDGKEYFFMGSLDDGALIVNETNLPPDLLKQLSGSLCELFKAELIKAYMPEFCCDEGEKIVASLVYNAQMQNTYVNLILI